MVDIVANLADVKDRVAQARLSDNAVMPALVAVSKRQSDDRINAALAAGHRVFGENRVQEAEKRWASKRVLYPELRLHLIGPLQTNKAADAVALFDVIEVVDDLIMQMYSNPRLRDEPKTPLSECWPVLIQSVDLMKM